jgi:hypothetical protein
MDHLFDAFSKSLTESVPRRESLRRLGAVFAGAVLSPLGLETAWAQNPDPCKAFCKCRNATQQNQCLAACRQCNGNRRRLAGSCGNYTCCAVAACKGVCSDLNSNPNCGACGNDCRVYGETCCGNSCADLANDAYHCGACGNVCPHPVPGEVVACISGSCVYDCAPDTVDCNGICTDLTSDPDNCGACGNVCPDSAACCSQGECVECPPLPYFALCNGVCVNLLSDNSNCGACGNVCTNGLACSSGTCWDPVCQFVEC